MKRKTWGRFSAVLSFGPKYRWDVNTYAVRLGTLLSGKVSDVYVGLSDSDAEDYEKLKVSFLTRFRPAIPDASDGTVGQGRHV